ncbi:MAG: hypothetical protein KUG82_08190 [Pseudomonadales bacterium]|nr:hypothetical protein [Pseudomonadales bacterium]
MFLTARKDPKSSTTLNLHHLFVLRIISIAGQVLAIGVAAIWLEIPLPILPLSLVFSMLVMWNLLTWWRVRWSHPIQSWEFFLQIVIDVLGLTGVLYFAGGATNPFAWFYLLPLMIAATVLSNGYTWAVAGLTTVCYSLLMVYYTPLHLGGNSHGGGFELHVFGMWFGFMLSAGLVAYFVAGMANSLRDRDRNLAQAREQALRDERLVALGTLAAGAAHELGTPLGTMAIVTGDLLQEYPAENGNEPESDLHEKLEIIRSQIKRCKEALSIISASAGEAQSVSGEPVAVDRYLEQLIAQWRTRRTAANLKCGFHGERPSPLILAENVLSQALTNILDNAADASPDFIELKASWDAVELVIEVTDRGPGLSAVASESAGKRLFTSKKQGLGLGLFLAHASVERLGGSITLFNREEGGVCTRIILPLLSLTSGASQ